MNAVEEAFPIVVWVHYTCGERTGNAESETWIGVGPHNVPTGPVWERGERQRTAMKKRTNRNICERVT